MKRNEPAGRVALITGGATGIGRAIVRRLARDGFAVVINYNTSKKEACTLAKELDGEKQTHSIFRADISKSGQVKGLLRHIQRKFGRLDIVINNAGVNQIKTLEESSLADFDRVLNVNTRGAVLVTKHLLPLLKKSSAARIIFITSTNPFRGSPNKAAYTTSKAALLGLSRSLSIELAPNVLVNAVAPGYIDTDMFHRFQSEPLVSRIKKIPLARLGKPEDVANVVSFLCSEDSDYITGQCIHVNGGAYFG